MYNSNSFVHLWSDDFSTTACSLMREQVVPTRSGPSGTTVYLCPDCYHLSAGHVRFDPTPVEASFLEVLFPNA